MKYFLAILLVLASLNTHAGLVKWVDAQGVVHYSNDKPPRNVKAESVTVSTATRPPAASEPAAACDKGGAACDGTGVNAKLGGVMQSLAPIKTALSMYHKNYGNFPAKPETVAQGTPGQTPDTSLWNSLGFSTYPPLPPEVASISYVPFHVQGKGAGSFGIILTLRNIKAGTIDGQLVGFSASDDMVITGPSSATEAAGMVHAPALNWFYSCHQSANQPVDPLVTSYFANAGAPMVCR